MILTDFFYLKPDELYDVNSSIYNKINEKCFGFCSQDVGYIISFNNIVKINNNIISRSGNEIVFKVSYDVNVFKPNIDDEYEAIITNIFDEGIILEYLNKIRILIPKSNLNENGFEFTNNTYNNWNIGDTINIKITQIKYEKNNFICIANLKFYIIN